MSLPKPNGEFEWLQESWGAALRCVPLGVVALHRFSTRALELEAVGPDGATGWQELARALGVAPESLVRIRQVHGTDVFEAARHTDSPDADIAITDDPAVAVSVKGADCVPILLADRRTGAIAAIHAGWKGTAEGVAAAGVQALMSRYGTNPDDVIAAVGPSIGPCCYEVGSDLPRYFASHAQAPNWFSRDAKPHLDLWRATRDQLELAGVPPQQIHVCELCTFEHPELFHSYRRDGRIAGRLVAAIRSAPGRTP